MSIRRDLPLAGGLLLFGLALVLNPGQAAEGARAGLTLCGQTVLPALFPFFVLSGLVVELGYAQQLGRLLSPIMGLFGVGGAGGSALLLGLVGGYPLGARTVAQLYRSGSLSQGEAERLLLFCNNAGPAFLLGVVGGSVFGSAKVGALLLGTHVAGALLLGLLCQRFHPRQPAPVPPQRTETATTPAFAPAFTKALGGAVTSCLNVCACVVLFGVVLGYLKALLPLLTWLPQRLGLAEPCATALLRGMVEMTNGVADLTGCLTPAALLTASFLLGFGGLSVFCQTAALLSGSGLSPLWCLKGQLLHGLLAALLTLLVVGLVPEAVETALLPNTPLPLSSALPLLMGSGAWAISAGLCLGCLRGARGRRA
jgi:sporulation integral membrane protein YlbJ